MPDTEAKYVLVAKWPYLKGGCHYYASPGWTARKADARRYFTFRAALLAAAELKPTRYISIERLPE